MRVLKLITDNDEDAFEVISNVTEEEWIHLLKDAYKEYQEQIEKFARERYRMHAPNEDVFVVE